MVSSSLVHIGALIVTQKNDTVGSNEQSMNKYGASALTGGPKRVLKKKHADRKGSYY
jgi:hypothetical protein